MPTPSDMPNRADGLLAMSRKSAAVRLQTLARAARKMSADDLMMLDQMLDNFSAITRAMRDGKPR